MIKPRGTDIVGFIVKHRNVTMLLHGWGIGNTFVPYTLNEMIEISIKLEEAIETYTAKENKNYRDEMILESLIATNDAGYKIYDSKYRAYLEKTKGSNK